MASDKALYLRRLLEGLPLDAAATGKRWSLRQLAKQEVRQDEACCNPASATLLLGTVQRLAVQHERLRQWKTHLQAQKQYRTDVMASAVKRLDTLQHIHADTYRIGKHILTHDMKIMENTTHAARYLIHTAFCEIRARHAKTIATVVDLVTELRNHGIDDDYERRADAFLRRRIGIQLLCDHHIALHLGDHTHGGVTVDANILTPILPNAISEAQHVADLHLQVHPEVLFTNSLSENGVLKCTMVKPWFHHALVELLKNAMESSVKQMKLDRQSTPSPIYITFQQDAERITLDLTDSGTGVPDIAAAFRLGHTTAAHKRWDRLDAQQSYAAVSPPLSSLGVGLPMSRHYMEHFGGSLVLFNNATDSRGCTARLILCKDDTIRERIVVDDEDSSASGS